MNGIIGIFFDATLMILQKAEEEHSFCCGCGKVQGAFRLLKRKQILA